jgi:hypothetical protein
LTQCSVPLTAEARVRSHMVFVMGRVRLGQVSLRGPQLSAVSIMPPALLTHPLFICFDSAVKTLHLSYFPCLSCDLVCQNVLRVRRRDMCLVL